MFYWQVLLTYPCHQQSSAYNYKNIIVFIIVRGKLLLYLKHKFLTNGVIYMGKGVYMFGSLVCVHVNMYLRLICSWRSVFISCCLHVYVSLRVLVYTSACLYIVFCICMCACYCVRRHLKATPLNELFPHYACENVSSKLKA